jgi:hypothetical protein
MRRSEARITTAIKLIRSNQQEATYQLQLAACNKKIIAIAIKHTNCKNRCGVILTHSSQSRNSSLCRQKLEIYCWLQFSRAVLRVGEWLQEIAYLNIFKHVKNAIKLVTSLQLGQHSCN